MLATQNTYIPIARVMWVDDWENLCLGFGWWWVVWGMVDGMGDVAYCDVHAIS